MTAGRDHLTALTWPEDTFDYQGRTYRIRGIPIHHPDRIAFIHAPYYPADDEQEEQTLQSAVDVITAEAKGVTAAQAKRAAKMLGLQRRPQPLPDQELLGRQMAAAVIMGTLEDDGTPTFGWRPGTGIPRDTAAWLRSTLPGNDLAAWATAITNLSMGTITREQVEQGKASSDDGET